MLCCLELYRLPVDTHESTTLFVLAYLVFGARSWLVKLCKVLLAAWVDWHLAVSLLTVDCVKHHSIPFDEGRVILDLTSDEVCDSECHLEVSMIFATPDVAAIVCGTLHKDVHLRIEPQQQML